jgi:hypothetical protein
MTKTKRPCEAADTDANQLADAIGNLTDHVSVLREAIDELRSSIQWGLQNGGFKSEGEPRLVVDTEEIKEAVVESLSEVGDELSQIVSESMKEPVTDFKDTVDQFSLDIQFAVRRIGEHIAAAERYRQGCLFSDDR